MSGYDNTNSGIISKNDRKEKEAHPDNTGSAEIKCPHCGVNSKFWVSAWVKTFGENAKRTGRYFSLSFKPQEAKQESTAPTMSADTSAPSFDDDIPF